MTAPQRACSPITEVGVRRLLPVDVIVLAVRWYLRFGLSYRDVEELLTQPQRQSRPRHHLPVGPALHPAAVAPPAHVGTPWEIAGSWMRPT